MSFKNYYSVAQLEGLWEKKKMRYAFYFVYHIGAIKLSIKVTEIPSVSLILQAYLIFFAACIDP